MTRAAKNAPVQVIRRGQQVIDIPEEPGDEFELSRAIDELSEDGEAKVYIYRQRTHARDKVFVRDVPASEFRIPMLQESPFNGGKFRIQLRDAEGHLVKNELIEVEPVLRGEHDAPTSAAPATQGSDGLALIAAAMTTGFQEQGKAILQFGEMMLRQREPPKTLKDMMDEASVLKNLLAPVASPVPVADPLETVTKILGFVRENFPRGADGEGGERGGGTGPYDVLNTAAKELLPLISQFAQKGAAIPEGMAPDGTMLPAPVRAIVSTYGGGGREIQPTTEPPMNPIQAKVQQELGFLVKHAAKGSDPALYAAVVCDNAPPALLASFMSKVNWFDELCQYLPEARQYPQWFAALHEEINTYLTNENEPDDTGGHAAAPPGS